MANLRVYLNTFAQIASKISTALLSIVLIKILTNYLDVADYGLYSKIYNFMGFFSVIADLGIYTITIREISEHKDDEEKVKKIVGNMFILRTIMGVVAIAVSLLVASFLPGYNSKLALISIFITGFFVLFGLWNSAILSVLQAYLKTEFSLVSSTLGKIVNVAGIAAVAYIFFPKTALGIPSDYAFDAFVWIIITGLLGNIVMASSLFWYARKHISFHFQIDKEMMVSLVKTSFSYGLALFLNVVYFKIDVLLLSLLEAPKMADVSIALYNVPMKIVEVGMLFGTLFLNSMLPLFTQSMKKKQPEKLKELVQMSFCVLYSLGFGIVCFLLANGEQILRLLATKDYVTGGLSTYTSLDSLQITSFVFLFYFLSSLFTYILIAHNEQGKLLSINGILTVINIIGNILVIPLFSFVGSSVVTLVCQVLLLIMTYRATRHLVHFSVPWKFVGMFVLLGSASLFASIFLANSLHLTGLIELIVSILVFGVLYGVPLAFLLYKEHAKNLESVVK